MLRAHIPDRPIYCLIEHHVIGLKYGARSFLAKYNYWVTGKKPADKKPPTLSPPVGFTIKRDTRYKYYPRTVKFRIHIKNSHANNPASFCAILCEN